jgi:hypothetical protein
MARPGSNKPAILQSRVIELSATGMSGRKIARGLNLNRRTVARILAGTEAQAIVIEARKRARQMVEKADAALHKSLDRGSSRTAIAVLRGAGIFETRAEALVRYHYRDRERAVDDLAKLTRQSRLAAERKFGRAPTDEQTGRLDRLALIERERITNGESHQSSSNTTQSRSFRKIHRRAS